MEESVFDDTPKIGGKIINIIMFSGQFEDQEVILSIRADLWTNGRG